MEWIVEVVDESALRDHVCALVKDSLEPHALAGEASVAAAGDVGTALMQIASRQLLAGTVDVPGLGLRRLDMRPQRSSAHPT